MENKKEKDILINIPMRLRYYLDPLFILIGAAIVCIAIWYVGRLV